MFRTDDPGIYKRTLQFPFKINTLYARKLTPIINIITLKLYSETIRLFGKFGITELINGQLLLLLHPPWSI